MTRIADALLSEKDEWVVIDTPVGDMMLIGDPDWLHFVHLPGSFDAASFDPERQGVPSALGEASAQIGAYFEGRLRDFSLPLQPAGTAFQTRVWFALSDIAYGATESYGHLAARIGNPNACRAVGLANGRNPIPLVLPCHRVIGSNGSLTGYGGGLNLKRWLLEHEAASLALSRS